MRRISSPQLIVASQRIYGNELQRAGRIPPLREDSILSFSIAEWVMGSGNYLWRDVTFNTN